MVAEMIRSFTIITFEAICCKLFFEIFLNPKEYLSNIVKRCCIIILTVCFILIAVFGIQKTLFKCISTILVMTIIIKIYYDAKLIQILFLSGICEGLLLSTDFLMLIGLRYLIPKKHIYLLNDPTASTLIGLLCKVVFFVILLLLKKIWNRDDELNMISDEEWIRFSYFPILTVVVILTILVNFNYEQDEKSKNTLLIISFGLVLMNLVVFYLIRDIVKREVNTRNMSLLQERAKNEMSLYQNMSVNYKEQRKQVHEYKNQIKCIQGLLLEGHPEEALSYVSGLAGDLQEKIDFIKTNNVVVDAVLNQEYRSALSKGITITILADNLSGIQVAEQDLVTILSNVLNNAIEACEKLERNKVISFTFTDNEDQTLLVVKNPISEPLIVQDNHILTSKPDKRNHGIGLTNVRHAVEKYGGTCAIRCKDGNFCFSAIIPHRFS